MTGPASHPTARRWGFLLTEAVLDAVDAILAPIGRALAS